MTASDLRPTWETASPAATEALAAWLATHLRAGDVVELEGGLGAGKTAFTRGLVRGLGHPDPREVASPTFALHHRYEGGRLPVDHLDLYRLPPDRDALARQGLLDSLSDPGTITVLEWGERIQPRLAPRFVVHLDVLGEGRRRVFLTGPGAAELGPPPPDAAGIPGPFSGLRR